MNEKSFKCDKCGLCCLHIDNSPVDIGLNRGNGVCCYFDENTRLCTIYSTRPLLCNVDELYNTCFIGKMTREEYYELNYTACKKLKNKYGSD